MVYSGSGGDGCGGGVDIGPFYCFSIQICSLYCRVDTSDMSFVIFNESGCLALVMLALNPLSHVMRSSFLSVLVFDPRLLKSFAFLNILEAFQSKSF